VIDADALWVLGRGARVGERERGGALARLAEAAASSARRDDARGGLDVVVTPHLGEAERLVGEARDEIARDRVGFVRRSADAMRGTFLLKGAPTLVGDRDGAVSLNTSGNAGMATAGAGDVLTGVLAGLIAQGMSAADAARAGAYLHGRAGDLAAQARGFRSLIAGDIADALSRAIADVDERAARGEAGRA
jgi:NAD(P)H-hydrate epimerase